MGVGLDPPGTSQVHEVTVRLNGPCSKEKFDAYTKALKAALDTLATTYGIDRSRIIVSKPKEEKT